MTAVATELPVSPFKGLANYTEQDAALFFGRDREREIIIANLKARRLTLLYGESGVGKSSLLRAGVMADLAETARQNLADIGTPEHLPVIFSAWSDEPVAGLAAAIRSAVQTFADDAGEPPESGSLVDVIAWAAECADAHLLIILDQFEEYFLYHATDKAPGTFAAELPDVLNRRGVQANVLVSIREDALAKLDVFKRDIPRLFDSSLRVHHLDIAAAREAIERPVERYNALAAADERVVLEAGLVAAVIDQVKSGRVVLEQTGQGTLEHADDRDDDGSDRIETPYLQLVMARLWNVEEARGSPTMRVATLAELGGAQEIVRTHLDAALHGLDPQEKDTTAALFHQLVTPSGTKIAHAVPDLAEYARRPEPEVRELLEKLARPETRILRPVPPPPGEEGPERFEIFHDVLAPSVLAWRTRHTAARRIEEQRRAARAAMRKRLLRVVGLVGALALAAVVFAVVSNAQRRQAQEQEARAQALAAEASRLGRVAERQATRAEDEAARSRVLKGRAEEQKGRAEEQKGRAEEQKGRAEAQAAQAHLQKGRAEEQAARARVLAEQNRHQAAQQRKLAKENQHNADEAQKQKAKALEALADAKERKALAEALVEFDVQPRFAYERSATAVLGSSRTGAGPWEAIRAFSACAGGCVRVRGNLSVKQGTVVAAACLNKDGLPGGGCVLSWKPATKFIRINARGKSTAEWIDQELRGEIPYGSGLVLVAQGTKIGGFFHYGTSEKDEPAFVEESSKPCRPPGSGIARDVKLNSCPAVRGMRAPRASKTVNLRPRIRLRGKWSTGTARG